MRATDPPLARPRLILGIALAVAALLWALFPGRTLDARIAHQTPGAVSLAYVRSLVRARPSETAPRLRLAEIERLLGHFAAAEVELRPLLDAEGSVGIQARRQHLALGLDLMNAASPEGRAAPAREAIARLDRVVALDAARVDDGELERLARIELAFERPGRAAALYERVARRRPDDDRARREAVRWYRAAEDHARADALDAPPASAPSPPPEPPRISPAEGAESEPLRPRRRRPACGVMGAAGRPDPVADEREADRLLAATRVLEALPLVERAARARPQDVALWQKLATVATWSSRPDLALEAWTQLARGGDPDALRRALELARALHDGEAVLALLALQAGPTPLGLEALRDRVARLEALGRPGEALDLFVAHEGTLGAERTYWTARGELLERRGDLAAALLTAQEVQRRFAPRIQDVAREMALLWRLGRPAEAFERAAAAERRASTSDAAFWRLYADLAWTLVKPAEAARAHRTLWNTGARRTPVVAERVLALASDAGRLDEIIQVGRAAYQLFHQPHHLLWAMEAAITGGRDDPLGVLLALAERDEARLAGDPRYWRLKGQAAKRLGRASAARAAFERAAALAPGNVDARVELLWLAIERRDDDLLAREVRSLSSAAETEPSLWEVLALAHDRLGDKTLAASFGRRHRGRLLEALPAGGRAAPADRRADATGQLLPATLRLQMALDETDVRAARVVLDGEGAQLALPERVYAEVALGRDASAWALLMAPDGARAPGNADELFDLASARWELSQGRPPSFEAAANVVALGTLSTLEQRLSGSLPLLAPGLFAGLDLTAREPLDTPERIDAAWIRNEYQAGVHLGLITDHWRGRLAGAAASRAGRVVPSARFDGELQLGIWGGLGLAAAWNQLPTETDALRAIALRSVVSLETIWKLTERDRIALGGGVHRFDSRAGSFLARGAGVSASVEHDFVSRWLVMTPRLDFEAQRNRLARALPPDLMTALGPNTSPDDLLWTAFQTPGAGLTLSRIEVGSRRPVAVRAALDGWAGWLLPAGRLTYGAEATIDLGLGSHGLALKGFFQADRGGGLARGAQRHGGVLVAYSLKRF